MNALRSVVATFALALATSCTSVTVDTHAEPDLEMLRSAGYRIAVIPFSVSAPDDGFLTDSLAAVGELISLEGSKDRPMREQLGELLTRDVITWLQQTEFEVVDPWFAGTVLGHSGWTLAQQQDHGRVKEIANLLKVDGVLFGDVRGWNRSYYVVQSTVDVRLACELLDGATGRRLFTTDRTEQIGSGVTGGPTGYVSAATEPLAGLRGSNLRSLTRSVARNVVTDLAGGALGNQPGPLTPRLSVVALAKDHGGPFRQGERVDVIAIGSPDCDVRFDVGRLRIEVPMQQTNVDQRDRGSRATYLGHYVVDTPDLAQDLPVVCTIQRGALRRSLTARYRFEGAVSLDGSASR